jgi:hypothetical protein
MVVRKCLASDFGRLIAYLGLASISKSQCRCGTLEFDSGDAPEAIIAEIRIEGCEP